MAQTAELRLELRSLSVVVSHCYIIISSWFGETPDEDSGHGGTAVQGDWASHCRCNMGTNVFHLLGVMYLKTCNTRQLEWVTPRKEKLWCCFWHIDKIGPYKLRIDGGLIVTVFKKVLQDLTVRWEWTASAFEDEQHIIKYTHSLSASGLFDQILWPSLWLRLAIWHNNDSSLWWRESLLAPTCLQLNLFVVKVSFSAMGLYLVEEEPASRAASKNKESSSDSVWCHRASTRNLNLKW